MFVFFFFFKQKTAYEMRISDWSSDVCSSDLATSPFAADRFRHRGQSAGPDQRSRRRSAAFWPASRLQHDGSQAGYIGQNAGGVTRLSRTCRHSQEARRPVIAHVDSRTIGHAPRRLRSEEPTSELQSLMRISSADFCLKKKTI